MNRTNEPGPIKQFWWDLLPKNCPDWLVPPRSGLNPAEPNVDWITKEIAEDVNALAQTQRAHDLERERADSLEKKATALVTLCLSLLATALTIGGYQVGRARRHLVSGWLIVPDGLAVLCLVLATLVALEVQRVGVYQWQGAEPLGRQPGGLLGLVQAEEKGRRFAKYTAGRKADAFLQARAWLSRALVALLLSGLVTIYMASNP